MLQVPFGLSFILGGGIFTMREIDDDDDQSLLFSCAEPGYLGGM
jgi:hypothetical protein